MSVEQPKYLTLLTWIKEQIGSSGLKPGDKFYSENELSAMFGLSRQTVRQAVGLLEKEGVLERRRGSGTYVTGGARGSRPSSNTVAVISTYLDGYIFPNIIKGIETVLADNGYSMQLALTHNKVENEFRVLKALTEKPVDGVILEPAKSALPNPNKRLYEIIRSKNIPLIFFNAWYPDMDFPYIAMDDRMAGGLAANCLINAGHKKIAGLFQSDDRQGLLRYEGYIQALREAGLEVESGNVLWFSTEDIPYLEEDINRVKRCIDGCTGVVCYNDQIAFTIVTELQKQGIKVPDELSVVGIDNSELASICEVPLTSVAHPIEKLGMKAAENILELIKDPSFNACLVFEPELAERSSVKYY